MVQEKIAILREHESLQKENDRLKTEKQASIKNKDLADGQVMALTKSLETLQNNIKEKEILVIIIISPHIHSQALFFGFSHATVDLLMLQVKDLKQSLDHQRKELNNYRAETTSLKMPIERTRSAQHLVQSNVEQVEEQVDSVPLESYKEQIEALQMELEQLKAAKSVSIKPLGHKDEMTEANDDVVKLRDATKSSVQILAGDLQSEDNQSVSLDTSRGISITLEKVLEEPATSSSYESSLIKEAKNSSKHNAGSPRDDNGLLLKTDSLGEANIEKMVCFFHSFRNCIPSICVSSDIFVTALCFLETRAF